MCRLVGSRENHEEVPKASPKSVFGKAVLSLREQRGYSQEELAERAGHHRNYVGGVERGERNVALEKIVKLAVLYWFEQGICLILFRRLDLAAANICRMPSTDRRESVGHW